MASLLSRGAAKSVSSVFCAPTVAHAEIGGARGGAKLKEVKGRIRSVKNIGKITKTMKMIASARLREAQTRMEKARPFSEAPMKTLESAGFDASAAKVGTLVSVFSDRGLCGGLNGNVSRLVQSTLKAREKSGTQVSLVGLGDKSTSGFGTEVGKVAISFGETSKRNLSFMAVSEIAEQLLAQKPEAISIAFNKFHSIISMKPTIVDLPGLEALTNSTALDTYEFEDDGRLFHVQDFYEYSLATALFGAYTENMASELGSRMTAMDNATRNAGDMLKKLEVYYNRGRQAAITTELTEIISGAAAIE